MGTNYHNWIEFIKAIVLDFTVLQNDPGGNPLLWVQIAGERVRIIHETDSDFSFWIERFEGDDGETGDELVVDVGAQGEELRLARNVVEAFLKRRTG
ncbi:MAG: hypothetical protein SH848_20200 [Saprospiraceae bacterium]|nr:hypothetical protein [Saprospiraceae bacterium]MDZ4706262.1 hypothetical protein [Saprospiraceae bacterium]